MGNRSRQRRLLFFITGVSMLLLIGQMLVLTNRWLNQSFPGFFVHQNLTVAPYSLPGWTGAGAGFESLDRIVAVDGKAMQSPSELYTHVRALAPHTPIHYQVARDGRQLDVVVLTQEFVLRDWLFSFGIYVLIGLAFLTIGVMPYFYRSPSPVALPLCFMVMAVFIWFQTTMDFLTEGWWPKEIRIFALCLTPSAAIHLALLLNQAATGRAPMRFVVATSYAFGVLMALANSVSFYGPAEIWRQLYRASYGFVFCGALAFLLITASALRRTGSDLERSRLRVMLVGALAGFLLPALATVLTSTLKLSVPYNLALIPTVIFPISVVYALLKYQLFELGQALQFALSRVALLALLVLTYALVAIVSAPLVAKQIRDPMVLVLFSVVTVILFNPLLRRLEILVDRFIYRQDYDAPTVQAEVSLFLRTLDSAPALAKGFIARVAGPLGIERATIFYRTKNASQWLVASSDADELENPQNLLSHPLWTGGNFRAICRTEVAWDPRFEDRREDVFQLCERLRAEILLPLVFAHEVRGVFCCGVKRAGREYSAGDIGLLATLTDQLALSLENGRLYEESDAARQKAEATSQRLIEMDRLKKDFVANICHEIRTPVSTIIGFAELLRAPASLEETDRVVGRLIDNGQQLATLMDNLMNYSRLEAHGSAMQLESVNLKEMVAGLTIMTQRLIRARPIQFDVRLDSSVDEIETDRHKLQQVVLELLTNAIKFTDRGRVELSVRENREGGVLEIAVADTGVGIRQEDQALIFEEFRQLDGSSTRRYGGTGVGLGLCKKFAAALGGEINLASEIGIGSVFKLLLPLKGAMAATLRQAA